MLPVYLSLSLFPSLSLARSTCSVLLKAPVQVLFNSTLSNYEIILSYDGMFFLEGGQGG